MKLKVTFLLFLAAFSSGTFSQKFNQAKIDALMDVLATNDKAMGSLCIAKNGVVIYSKAIGYSSINGDEKVAATTKTKYRIGSISKMFTATIIFQLIEEGKLSLTTPLGKFYPSLPNAAEITISNLLDHRSGLHDFTRNADFKDWMASKKSKEEMLAIIAKDKPDFEPDMKAQYSNTNFVLLGYIIEDICKKPYADVLAERVVKKAGLTSTYYGDKADIKKDESYSYKHMSGWTQVPESDMSIPGAAGAIVSTPTDLTKFITALFQGKLVSAASVNRMKALIDDYGMGVLPENFYDKTGFGHSGAIDGFLSTVKYFPADSVSIAYCTNGVVYDVDDILIGALRIYYNMPYNLPTFDKASVPVADLDKYLGVYSSKQLPLKITISKDGTTLIAQATGQPSFALDAKGNDTFRFDQADVTMQFKPAEKTLVMKQRTMEFLFTKE